MALKSRIRLLDRKTPYNTKSRTTETHRRTYYSKISTRIKSYKNRANRKGIDFSLSEEEFEALINADCTYCPSSGGTIDRIDSKKGYVSGNCQPCCSMCNMMKYQYDANTFMNQIKRIYNHCCNKN